MKTTITLTQKNSDAIAIDALPRLKLLAMASARLRQTEQQVKVGMTVTHKSYGAGKIVGEWGTIRSGVPCKRMFEKSWQIKTHGTRTRVRPSCLEAGMGNIVGEI